MIQSIFDTLYSMQIIEFHLRGQYMFLVFIICVKYGICVSGDLLICFNYSATFKGVVATTMSFFDGSKMDVTTD